MKTLNPQVTSLDQIVKIYKNVSGKVIGIHTISVSVDRTDVAELPPEQKVLLKGFPRRGKISSDFTRFNLTISGSRIISSVQFIGKYDDFQNNETEDDIVSVTYYGDAQTNDLIIPLNNFPTIGDTI